MKTVRININKMKTIVTLIMHTLVSLLLFISNPCFSQEECIALLKDGVYAQLKEITYYNEEYSARTAICDIYSEYKKTNNLAKASGNYAQIFKANGSYSAEEIEKISKIYCGETFSQSDLLKTAEIYRSYVDPNLMRAFQACVEVNSFGVKLKMSPTNYNTFNQLTIVASSNTNPKPKVVQLLYLPSKLDIIGNLGQASRSEISLDEPKSLIAIRKDYNESDLKSEPKRMLASAHNLVLTFQNGQAATITFPEIWSNPVKKLEQGIGQIVSSMLDFNKFTSVYGETWMACNGQAAPNGSRYKEFVADNVPNLSGNRMITDIKVGTISDGKNIYAETGTNSRERWQWLLSLNNIQGKRWNGDFEQAVDNFVVSLRDNIVTAKGRTHNFKHNKWGTFNPGSANYIGIKSEKNIYYYVKIN